MVCTGPAAGGLRVGLLLLSFAAATEAASIQFGVAELPGAREPHGDSYVVAIPETETALIQHARALVDWMESGGDPTNSPGATIVVAEIDTGPDGVNRNFVAESEPLWSWHTVGTPSFADFTVEILDGWPTFVEQDVSGWIANTNGYIGFWGYTVTAELGPIVPEPSTMTLLIAGLAVTLARRRRTPR